jgi:TetR/AcrR family transcriptional repressor of bet genes
MTTQRQSTFTRETAQDRRQSLIEAVSRCLARDGAAGVSVRRICAEAGVSPGLLRHYFSGVSEAIAETYRWTGAQVADALETATSQAGPDPHERLIAYLTASFRPPIASDELLATWIAFWSLTRSDPLIADVHAQIYSDFRIGIERLIADYRPELTDRCLPAVALTALIDGLWLELSLGHAPFTADEASGLAGKWLDALLP